MIESKAKELALLEYRQAVIGGWTIRPKQRNAELAAQAAVVKAEAAAAKAEAKAAKLAEQGLEGEDGDGVNDKTPSKASRTVRKSSSSVNNSNRGGLKSKGSGGRKRKARKESETEESEEVDVSDDDDYDGDE
eukprot:GHUV01045448.1.p1 GENE.GHUV01045448.1~~GHUV01045448.1.p1  ORF type:complete len:133 (-),score=23.73 GHUV01045448.1:46-444(-)